jgi:hypothetical protein
MLVIAGSAAAQTTTRYENKLEERVAEYTTRGECGEALRLVRAGLAVNSPRAALLTGAMYEHGICVKQNWDTAVTYYVIAHDGGERPASLRLAAGYAAPAAGPDVAAALWWMTQSEVAVSDTCAVEASARSDPDRFVAALQKWPPARMAACNYWTGVMATIAGETQYPWERRPLEPAPTLAPGGKVAVRFTPGLAQVDIWTVGETGLFSAPRSASEALQLRASRKSRLEGGVRIVADRALARYPQPAGLPLTWFYDLGISYGSYFY